MYSDPALIRKHVVKLSLSDRESYLLDALCGYTGEQKAVLLREMLLQRAMEVMGHGLNGAVGASENQRPFQAQLTA
jgi:hypothetical protein